MSVYTWGLGKNGQLGTGKAETSHTPQLLTKAFAGHPLDLVHQISCGALFTAIVTKNGNLYTCGCGKFGRLGLESKEEDTLMFTAVNLAGKLGKVNQVSCGSWHASAVTESGQIFIWGHKKAAGNAIGTSTSDGSLSGLPRLLSFTAELRIAGVSCGHNYTYAWTVDGQVFSWGSGHCGVLGHGSDKDFLQPTKVNKLSEVTVKSVGAGHSHCGIVTADGLLFTVGKGRDGALGLGKSLLNDVFYPTKCSTDEDIIAVSCSKGDHHGHTLALTKEGKVLSWGDGYKGKLGLGHHNVMYSPSAIPQEYFSGEKVVSIAAGGIHSCAATLTGKVYTWGCGSDGRLGHKDGEKHRYLFRSDIPRLVEDLPKNSNYVAVSSSYYHTAALID